VLTAQRSRLPPGAADPHAHAARVHGYVVDCGACPYLPARRFHAFQPDPAPPAAAYRQLMDHRFRRSGTVLYLPMCPGCHACQPVRVDTAAFRPRKAQRRCAARNRDLIVTWRPRGSDGERAALYARYQCLVHGKADEPSTLDHLVDDGGVPGGELHARDRDGRLLAVSVCDRFADALSSVYCYYDPEQPQRGLGTFMALAEIEHCRAQGLPWWYLGFLVRGSAKMDYKARFCPQEVLEEGRWVRYEEPPDSAERQSAMR
jgi:arginyl-tRNA--protein-N-Asp/Glu arginylyltransferase